jgi:ribosome maturation factor RimP
MGPAEAIRDLAEPLLVAAGLELWDVEVTAEVVRILVDRPGGIDLEALSTASASLSPLLDEHPEVVPTDAYQLEVSSPGVERTLRTPEQYRRYLGASVSVKTTRPVAGSRRLHGTLSALDDHGIRVDLDDAPVGAAAVAVPFSLISRTRTVLVWGPAPKAARPARTTPSSTQAPPSTQGSTSSKDAT